MLRTVFTLLLASTTLFAYAYSETDRDLDGVDDRFDSCPSTPLMDLVDVSGCSVKQAVNYHHFDLVLGVTYGQTDNRLTPVINVNTLSTTAQIDYYYKRFSLQLATSYYDSKSDDYTDSGLNDSVISMNYRIYSTQRLSVKLGVGAILPTYDAYYNNNNTDYLGYVNMSYRIDKTSVFAGYSYTMINDDNIIVPGLSVYYQNTNAYSLGAGYNLTSKLYANISYYQSESFYQNVVDLKKVSAYMFYRVDQNWFCSFSYSKGLSDSTGDYYSSLRVGYYF